MTALEDAAALVGEVRAQCLLAGDWHTAARLHEVVHNLIEEDEYLDGVEHGLPLTDHAFPPGAALGWLLRNDPHVRRIRELRGLPVPVTQC